MKRNCYVFWFLSHEFIFSKKTAVLLSGKGWLSICMEWRAMWELWASLLRHISSLFQCLQCAESAVSPGHWKNREALLSFSVSWAGVRSWASVFPGLVWGPGVRLLWPLWGTCDSMRQRQAPGCHQWRWCGRWWGGEGKIKRKGVKDRCCVFLALGNLRPEHKA